MNSNKHNYEVSHMYIYEFKQALTTSDREDYEIEIQRRSVYILYRRKFFKEKNIVGK